MKKFGSIKIGVPETLNFEGRNYPVKTDTGKISKRKGKPAIDVIPEDYDKEPRVVEQPRNRKWGTAKVEVPELVSYRNKPVDTVKEGDITIRNKEPSVKLITRGERLEVLDKGKQEKIVSHFLKMLDSAPIQAEDKANIKGEFIKVIKEKGIRAGLEHLMAITKEIQKMDAEERRVQASSLDEEDKRILRGEIEKGTENIDELRGEFQRLSNIEKGKAKLGKFKAKKEALIEKGREKLADLRGMGMEMDDDAYFQNSFF